MRITVLMSLAVFAAANRVPPNGICYTPTQNQPSSCEYGSICWKFTVNGQYYGKCRIVSDVNANCAGNTNGQGAAFASTDAVQGYVCDSEKGISCKAPDTPGYFLNVGQTGKCLY
ncbi:hypothetical protein BDR26DRAFT_893203 [Obelidium mucronatum]|nr:hypothetical protein BDR26DRAFT_893203 [Obelidium mucronatum]